MIDYHIHTKRCGHAVGEMHDYVEKAKEAGLNEIGFSDHLPLFHMVDPTLTMDWDEFPFYIEDVKKLKRSQSDISIRLGVEVDYVPSKVKDIGPIIDDYEFDYVMGSVHFIDGWGIDDRRYIDNYDNYDIYELYYKYFYNLAEAAKSGLFDVIAHPDLIKKYGFRPETDFSKLYEMAAIAIKEADIAIEVSSAGLRKPVNEIYPNQRFLEICFEKEIPVISGSDAHRPDEVGKDLDLVMGAIKKAGYKKIATFSERKRQMVVI